MSSEKDQPRAGRAELKRIFTPDEPRGYLSIDLLILYMLFFAVNASIYGILGAPERLSTGSSSFTSVGAAVLLHGLILAAVSILYITRYAGDTVGWWRRPAFFASQGSPGEVPAFKKVGWIVWGGVGAWLLATAGVRAVLVMGEKALGFNPWGVGALGRAVKSAYTSGTHMLFLLLLVGVVVAAPLGEELLFRRSIYAVIIEGLGGETLAVLGSGVLFAFTHGEPVAMFKAAVAGLIYAWAYHQTKSALVPILMHALFNALAVLAVLADFSPWLLP